MTTYSDFRAQVRRQIEEPTANVWADASILYWTNETVNDISSRVRQNMDENYTLSIIGVSDYPLPTDTQEISAVYFDGAKLAKESPESRTTIPGDSGTPLYYQRMDEVLRLRPTPDAVAELLIVRQSVPDEITADTDSMPFRSERNTLIEYGVLSRAFEQIGDWQTSDAYKVRYEATLATFDADASIQDDSDGASTSPIEVW
jgi:hypothetical protein